MARLRDEVNRLRITFDGLRNLSNVIFFSIIKELDDEENGK